MEDWLAKAAGSRNTHEIFRPGVEAELRAGVTTRAGEGPVAGFVLELGPVWEPLEG